MFFSLLLEKINLLAMHIIYSLAREFQTHLSAAQSLHLEHEYASPLTLHLKLFNQNSGFMKFSSTSVYLLHLVSWKFQIYFCIDEEKQMNASYIISVARKLGCSIFLLPEDILEVIIWSSKFNLLCSFVPYNYGCFSWIIVSISNQCLP